MSETESTPEHTATLPATDEEVKKGWWVCPKCGAPNPKESLICSTGDHSLITGHNMES